jgi:phosphotransferase system enzyme I (PtsI)
MTAEAGQAAGKAVGVCGEAAASPALAPVLVGLGVTTLSMSASAVADVRDALAAVTLAECREMRARR